MIKKYIIALTSGLGNQMFQYALYLYLKEYNHKQVCLYSYGKHLNEHNGFELSAIFPNIATPEKSRIISAYVAYYFFFTKNKNKAEKLLRIKIPQWILSILIPCEVVVMPNWDSYLFVNEIGAMLKQTFIFPSFVEEKDKQLVDHICQENSVSIHVRRSDFMTVPKWRIKLGDICDVDYYIKAINYIKERVDRPVFFIFSDTISWVKENLPVEDAVFVTGHQGKNSYRDMQLMSYCKYNILSNSSFGWWGAWLNRYPEKITIAPSKWLNEFGNKYARKFIFPEWIIIDNSKPNVSLIIDVNCSTVQIKNILHQNYEDFEVLLPFNKNTNKIKDSRLKDISVNRPKGSYQFNIEHSELVLFRNRSYLKQKFLKHLAVVIEADKKFENVS